MSRLVISCMYKHICTLLELYLLFRLVDFIDFLEAIMNCTNMCITTYSKYSSLYRF